MTYKGLKTLREHKSNQLIGKQEVIAFQIAVLGKINKSYLELNCLM